MKICFVTTGQPSTNPRLVKEADACVEAGYDVHVIAAHWADWATALDAPLLASRAWAYTFIDWRRSAAPALFWKTRVRHWLAREAAGRTGTASFAELALSRVGPELRRAACAVRSDLFIAHNLGALVAATAAARRWNARLGFDAEDFHSGQFVAGTHQVDVALTQSVERQYVPCCDYVTAAAPGIAEAYRDLCGIPLPTCVLNVFPMAQRPAAFRASRQGDRIRLYWFSQTIGPDRGLEQAVRALGLLQRTDIELHVRGEWQAGFEARLRALAADASVADARLVSLPPAAADDMVREAALYDVGLALEPGVSPNNALAVSNKIFTYLLGGAAVVATRTTGQQRLLPALGSAAEGCDVNDPASLAAAITRLTDSPARLERARRTAWELGETRFNWDVEKHGFLEQVSRTLRARTGGAVA